jgi:hypothetical protein
VPRWRLCDLEKISMVLDDRWGVGCWNRADIVPGRYHGGFPLSQKRRFGPRA